MAQNKRNVGSIYEKIAGMYLEEQGYVILEYNMQCKAGEIDIIAKEGEYLVFVEVKYRSTGSCGDPLEAVSVSKQKNISKCAVFYLKKHGLWDMPIRFDVIGVLGEQITLIRNAFPFCGKNF